MRLRACIPLALLLVVALAVPAGAATGADPPSDILQREDYYLPYDLEAAPGADAVLRSVRLPRETIELEQVLAAARDRKRPFKVAVIGSELDLGGVPDLIAKPPQRYAAFLLGEIAPVLSKTGASLLVVTPRGVAVAGPQASGAARAALARVRVKDGAAALTGAAVEGVRAVAAANGHPLPEAGADDDGGGSGGWLLAGVLLLLLAGGALALRLRLSRASA